MDKTEAIELVKALSEIIRGNQKCILFEEDAEAIDIVISELEKKTYSDTDLCEFVEWCSSEWVYYKPDNVWMKHTEASITRIYGTSKMKERWEKETGRRKDEK